MKVLLRNPSVQFFVVFVTAPVLAIVGEAIGDPLRIAGISGWLLCLLLISLFAIRSYRHERSQLPKQGLWSLIGGPHSTIIRYMIGVATLTVFSAGGTLFAAGLLLIRLWQLLTGSL